MISIEHIWSIFAITQALIVTLQVGTKLLLPPSSSSTSNQSQLLDQQQQYEEIDTTTNLSSSQLSLLFSSSSSSNGTIKTTTTISPIAIEDSYHSTTTTTSTLLEHNEQQEQHNIDEVFVEQQRQQQLQQQQQNDQEDIIEAFQIAVKIGFVSLLDNNNNNNKTIQNNNNNNNNNNMMMTVQNGNQTMIVTRHYKKRMIQQQQQEQQNEPYRMSMIPAIRVSNTNDEGNYTSINTQQQQQQQQDEVDHDTSHDLYDVNEYYEIKDYVLRNTTMMSNETNIITKTLTYATIRCFAPKTFHTLRSYYYYDNTYYSNSNTNMKNNNNNNNNIANEIYQQSIVLPTNTQMSYNPHSFARSNLGVSKKHSFQLNDHSYYKFLKTNSLGSQRKKNIFFYTIPTTRTTHRNDSINNRKNQMQSSYLIKSIHIDEFNTLFDYILPKYIPYMKLYGHSSLLNRIYGVYEIIIYENSTITMQPQQQQYYENDNNNTSPSNVIVQQDEENIKQQQVENEQSIMKCKYYLIVCNSIFDISSTNIIKIYDIKGSIHGRTSTLKISNNNNNNTISINNITATNLTTIKQPLVTCKDLDLLMDLAINNNQTSVNMNDIEISTDNKIMDVIESLNHTICNNTFDIHTTNDQLRQTNYNNKLINPTLDPIRKLKFIQQLMYDVQLLTNCSVMDYSLLIGIENQQQYRTSQKWYHSFFGLRRQSINDDMYRCHNHNNKNHTNTDPRLSTQFGIYKDQLVKYHFGIIDFLQPFNYKKELEYRYKGLLYKKHTYSCIPPDLYGQRFLNFISEYVS